MSPRKPPSLDTEIATLDLTAAEVETLLARFAFSPPNLLAGPRVTLDDVQPGTSGRHNQRAAANLLLALARRTQPPDDHVLAKVDAVLSLKPRDLVKRRGTPVDIETPGLVVVEVRPPLREPEPRRLGDDRALALRTIAHVAANGPTHASRLAIRDLLAWHAPSRLLSPVVLNALGVVAGVVDPATGRAKVPGPDPMLLVTEAAFSADEIDARQDDELVRLAKAYGWEKLNVESKPRTPRQWVEAVWHSGLTALDLYRLTGQEITPPKRPMLKAGGNSKQRVSDLRADPRFDALENAALKRLGQQQRDAEQLLAMRWDVWASAYGDREAKARLRQRAGVTEPLTVPQRLPGHAGAKVLADPAFRDAVAAETGLVAEQSTPGRPPARRRRP